jgi:pimeloyl-ACP methyl ester carboxylesterase
MIHHLPAVRYLQRPEGRLAYELHGAEGTAPLVVLLSGMCDLRSTYRHLTPLLVAAGYRVAVMELRGHGDSDATFSAYDDRAAASDLIALLGELGPAALGGHSMGAGAAVLAATEAPELVQKLILIGPFVRDPHQGLLKRWAFRVAMRPLWAARVWRAFIPTLYTGQRPEDFQEHLDAMIEALNRPGRTRALVRTTSTSHAPAEAVLVDVSTPTLVVMGELDPDFPDATAEARWIADVVGGRVVMVPDAGHYPHSQQPQFVARVCSDFLAEPARG